MTERQLELVFGQLRHPDADRIERELLDDGAHPQTARLATVLGQPVEEIERRKATPLLALDLTSGRRRPWSCCGHWVTTTPARSSSGRTSGPSP
ncbi:hypothetical protein [Streptomyces buecherae]|uniref:hypothetical protein n=1 Tax=Streptomyces buecherae TaxID=2763006 RepID=UPI003656F971